MNNKRLGNAFEREVCDWYKDHGYWVHFIAPDTRGAQPFDIIAVKNGKAVAVDCKTCVAGSFNISRLEDNQIMAFNRWVACGNEDPIIVVKHQNEIYRISFSELVKKHSIKLGG